MVLEGIMAFKVSLTGNNYISEKRKSRFEKALADGHRVKYGGNGQMPPTSKPETIVSAPAVEKAPHSISQQSPPTRDYSRLFDTLELGLKQSYGHQTETLRVHQQYLNNQAEYAHIFSQLMQQQGLIFSNGNTAPEKSEITLTVLNSLAKSIEQFHQHQTETLNVHNQFLNQQSVYSQAFVQLLQQQVNGSEEDHEDYPGNNAQMIASIEAPAYQVPTPPVPVQSQITPITIVEEPAVKLELPTQPTQIPESPAAPAQGMPAVESAAISALLLDIVSDKTGYPSEMLELDMDMEADLGIDSIKRVEILGALQDQAPDLPEIDSEALAELRTLDQIIKYIEQQNSAIVSDELTPVAVTPQVDSSAADLISEYPITGTNSIEMKSALIEIVSDKTGYPAEMLELDMDMEADLGIDSIKRVEILGALQDQYPGMAEIDADTLTDLRTLQQILDYIDSQETAEKKV
jgi:acyl carrier protein